MRESPFNRPVFISLFFFKLVRFSIDRVYIFLDRLVILQLFHNCFNLFADVIKIIIEYCKIQQCSLRPFLPFLQLIRHFENPDFLSKGFGRFCLLFQGK